MYLFLIVSLRIVFTLYMVLVLGHSILERVYAYRSAQRSGRRTLVELEQGTYLPGVDVVVPCFNEDPELLAACCRSLEQQDYLGRLCIWIVDDGSANRDDLREVLERYAVPEHVTMGRDASDPRLGDPAPGTGPDRMPGAGPDRREWRVLLLTRNVGKRLAQHAGLRLGTGVLAITIDSDTTIAPDGVRAIVSAFRDPRVGAVTGNIAVSNVSTNLLTRLISKRYRIRFERERAAQAAFDAVLCCSGPFSVYRRAALQKVWPDYVQQQFLNTRCSAGDDLHLTNLILADDHLVLYEPRARAFTNVPTSVRQYLRQQLRWNRSFYRELIWTTPVLVRRWRHAYLAVDVVARALLPFLLMAALVLWLGEGVLGGRALFLNDLSLIGAIILVNAIVVIGHTRNPAFFLLYGLLHVILLIPTRLHALISLADDHWGTRGHPEAQEPCPSPE
jgi:hyaluronan synthase/N-acetylglucosaminyltransferase